MKILNPEYPRFPSLGEEDLQTMESMLMAHETGDHETIDRIWKSELFDAALMHRFVTRTNEGRPVETWVAKALSERFEKLLRGGLFEHSFHLPGRPLPPRPFSKTAEKSLELHGWANALILDGAKVTDAIASAATKYSTSYESARAAYYFWKKKWAAASKKSAKTLEQRNGAED